MTGATGLIGSYILKGILENTSYTPVILIRNGSDRSMIHDLIDRCQVITGDLSDEDLLYDIITDVDYVIHSAAVVSFWNKEKDRMYRTNVEGTSMIVDACLANPVRKLIYISSVSALGRSKKDVEPISEKRKWTKDPANTHYAKSKHLAEMEVWRGIAEGQDAVILNPSVVIGSGRWESSSLKLIDDLYKGLNFYPTGSTAFTDVRDVANLVIQALESDIINERFVIAGANLTYREFFEKVASGLGIKGPQIEVKPALATVALFFEKIRSWLTRTKPILSDETVKIATLPITYDSSKSREVFGFEYRDLDQTIKEVCQAYLASAPKGVNPPLL